MRVTHTHFGNCSSGGDFIHLLPLPLNRQSYRRPLAHISRSADSFSSSYRRFGEKFPTFRAMVQAKLICEARLDPIRRE
jgi:hypothetical protein